MATVMWLVTAVLLFTVRLSWPNEVFDAIDACDLGWLKALRADRAELNQNRYIVEENRVIVVTPLMRAIEVGHPDIVKFLLENGASCVGNGFEVHDRNFEQIRSLTHLEEAINCGNMEILIHLLQHGADPNTHFYNNNDINSFFRSALAQCGSTRQRMILLSYGADPGIGVNSHMATPFDEALTDGDYLTAIVYHLWNTHPHPPVSSSEEANRMLSNFPWLQALSMQTIIQHQLSTANLPGGMQRLLKLLTAWNIY